MTYQVLESFEDLQDLRHPYPAGSVYPRKGYTPNAERITELCSANNKRGRAVITAIVEPVVDEKPSIPNEPTEPVKKSRKKKDTRKRVSLTEETP